MFEQLTTRGILGHVDVSAVAVKCLLHFFFVRDLLRCVISPTWFELGIRAGRTDSLNWDVSHPFGHFQEWHFLPPWYGGRR